MCITGYCKSFLFILDFHQFGYDGLTCSSLYIYLSLDLMSFGFCNFICVTISEKSLAAIFFELFFFCPSLWNKITHVRPFDIVPWVSEKICSCFYIPFCSCWIISIDLYSSWLTFFFHLHFAAKTNQWIFYLIYSSF